MQFELYQYQKDAIEHIIQHKGCGLFLEPGLGKTVITLTAVKKLYEDYEEISYGKVLVIAPLRIAKYVWLEELAKWDHLQGLSASIVVGTAKQRIRALSEGAHIYIINREMVGWLIEHMGGLPYDMVILDELSSFKSPTSQRFRMLHKHLKSARVVGLTGTPATNGYLDLWSQLYLLDGGARLEKTNTLYKLAYFYPLIANGRIVYKYGIKAGAREIIDNKISDICMSMRTKDYINMPDCIYNQITVHMSEREIRGYNDLKHDLILSIEDSDIVAANAAVLCNKLVQYANGMIYDDEHNAKVVHNRKIEALKEFVETCDGKSVLVFYVYNHDRDRILSEVKGSRLLDLDAWNKGQMTVALAHPASFGHGLNLQYGGSIIVWYGLVWSLELYDQANARLWRQGQKETVIIHHLIANDTIDTLIYKALVNKKNIQNELMEALKYDRKWIKK